MSDIVSLHIIAIIKTLLSHTLVFSIKFLRFCSTINIELSFSTRNKYPFMLPEKWDSDLII